SFLSILTSIEERLRNLDNIYSMQLSQTLENKLDQYNRKLEVLDSKIIRLEALIMLNLDKISENISTKNFKDDVTKTNTFRKIDSVYDGISHRLSYIDRKYETNFAKIQTKMDTTLTRLEKIEEGMITRDSDIDAELSDAIFAIDDLKTTYNAMEGKLLNITSSTFNVADMNSYIWKNSDTTEDDLKMIAAVVNSTKIEVQNGVRSLMLQIGKLSNKENAIPTESNDFEDINKKLTTNFEKVLTNQDLFLESCHRLQMDESQIESEISNMLEKLIDMLEKKMASEIKDINNFEKMLKNHDGRISRSMYQVNSNIISLFEKSTIYNDGLKTETKKISNDLDALFAFVQSTITTGISPSTLKNIEVIIDKLNKIENLINITNSKNQSVLKISNIQDDSLEQKIIGQIQDNSKILHSIKSHISEGFNTEHIDKVFSKILPKYLKMNCGINNDTKIKSIDEIEIDDETRKLIADIFGPDPDLMKVNVKYPEVINKKRKCHENNQNLIDIRAGVEQNCEEHVKNKYEDSEETTESTTDNLDILTDGIDITDITTEATTKINEDVIYSLLGIKPNDTVNEM
ncbi:hypothetical protein NQ314_017552, partial [Rhamnusium bicolor]